MKVALALVAALTLGGCQSVEQMRSVAPQQTDYTICTSLVAANPNMRQAAYEEQARRRLDCSPYAGAMAASQLQFNNGLLLLQASQPSPTPMPMPSQSVICTSRPGPGGTATTVCQ